MRSFIYIIILLTLSTSVFSWGWGWKGPIPEGHMVITPDRDKLVYAEGETATFKGDICKVWKGSSKNFPHCLPIHDHKIELKIFFPDFATEVTDQVTINKVGKNFEYQYTTPQLSKDDPNRFIILVGKVSPRARIMRRLTAKFNKRIQRIEQMIEHLEGSNHPWREKKISALTKFNTLMIRIVNRINEKLAKESQVVVDLRMPIQVDNVKSGRLYYMSMISGFMHVLTSERGAPIEGEKIDLEYRITNLTHKPYAIPDGDEVDEGAAPEGDVTEDNLKSFDYRIKLYWQDALKIDETGTIGQGDSKSFKITTNKLLPVELNKLKASFYLKKKIFHFQHYFKWGHMELDIPVAADSIVPSWLDTIPTEDSPYLQNFPIVSGTFLDEFGFIDPATIDIILDGNSLSNVALSSPDDGQTYKIVTDVNPLSEGWHTISFNGKDLAGNTATPEESTIFIDRTPPVIISNFMDGYLTNEPILTFPVSIIDDSPTITTIIHNGLEVESRMDKDFDLITNLEEGLNTIYIETTDAAGNVAETIRYLNIILDTIPPELSEMIPENNSMVHTLIFNVSGNSNEPLEEVIINDKTMFLANDKLSYSGTQSGTVEGPFSLNIKASDPAGNTTEADFNIEIVLKVLNEELISIEPRDDGLYVVGMAQAARPNIEVNADGGFFNDETVIANADGSFEIKMSYFTSVSISATDPAIPRTDLITLTFNADTTFSGVVKDTEGSPLPGVQVTIISSNQSAYTDASGVFSIPDPTTGDQLVKIDGTTILPEVTGSVKTFSALNIRVSLGTLQRNILDRPIFLAPLLLDGSATNIIVADGGIVTSANAPGVQLDIPAESAVFPEGVECVEGEECVEEGKINISKVYKDFTSIPVPEFAEPDFVYALEPSGTKFSKPVKLTLPNINEFPAGLEMVILTKNSEKGIWEIGGGAIVSADGSTIETKEGLGITHFSEVYASPYSPKLSTRRYQDIHGVDIMGGAVKASISTPSVKSMGQDFNAELIYNSRWSDPNLVVSALFNIPKGYVDRSSGAGFGIGVYSYSIHSGVQKWVEPQYIDTFLSTGNIHTGKMRYTGIPYDESVLSYALDTSSLQTGVYPYQAGFEVKLKFITIRTYRKRERKLWKVRLESYITTEIHEKVFPSELGGQIFVQNKQNSEVGQGWKIGGVSKIVNPLSPRIMIEEGNGDISSYTINNSIETLLEQPDIKTADLQDWSKVYFTDQNDEYIFSTDLTSENPTSSQYGVIPKYSGTFEVLSVARAWTNVEACIKYSRNYIFPRDLYGLQRGADGDVYGSASGGNISRVSASDNELISGDCSSGPTAVSQWLYEGHMANSMCASQYRNGCTGWNSWIAGYIGAQWGGYWARIGNCYNHGLGPKSIGTFPYNGFEDGANGKFNNPKGMTPGLAANTIVIADEGNSRVRLLNTETKIVTTIAGTGQTYDNGDGGLATDASIYHPRGVTYDNVGNLYISTENSYIRKIDPSGIISTYAGKPAGEGGRLEAIVPADEAYFHNPTYMVVDNTNGFLYISDTGNHRVVQIDMNTKIAKTVAGNGSCVTAGLIGDGKAALDASLCSPTVLGLDDNNNLIILDSGHNRFRRVQFQESEMGRLAYAPTNPDKSILIRENDGGFSRQYRSGVDTLYDVNGKQTATIDRFDNAIEYNYDGDRLTSVVSPAGATINYNYSGDKLDNIDDSTGREPTSFEYNGNTLARVIYPDGSVKSFIYDEKGRLTVSTDQRNNDTSYEYNDWGRLRKVIRADGEVIIISDVVSNTIGNGYTNGTSGGMLSPTCDNPSCSKTVNRITASNHSDTELEEDESGYITSVYTPGMGKILYERDLDGTITKMTRNDGSYIDYTYDADTGDLLSSKDSRTNLTMSKTYDLYGNVVTRTDARGGVFFNDYDLDNGQLSYQTNPIGARTDYTYGEFGLMTSRQGPVDSAEKPVRYGYDENGNIDTVTNELVLPTTYTRTDAGLIKTSTDANGNTTTYAYDSMNRLLSVTTPKLEKTSYTYALSGDLLSIIDPNGKISYFEYDSMGRVTKKTNPLGGQTLLTYDMNGNITQQIDPNGSVTTFEYNFYNKLLRKTLPDDEYIMTYGAYQRMSTIKNKNSLITFSYGTDHTANSVVSATVSGLGEMQDKPSTTLNFGYDLHGNRTSMSTSQGAFAYQYDGINRMVSLANHKGEAFSFDYDVANRLKSIARPSGKSTFYYNPAHHIQLISHKNNSLVQFAVVQYVYDDAFNRTSMSNSFAQHSYQYDENKQLVDTINPEVLAPYYREGFIYDSIGNRANSAYGVYKYDESGKRLIEGTRYFYTYDNNGNMTSKQEKVLGNEVTNYHYSALNQLTAIKHYDGANLLWESGFHYDALGRRMNKKVIDYTNSSKSKDRFYAYDGNEVLFEYGTGNKLLATYTHSTQHTDDILAVDITIDGQAQKLAQTSGSYFYIKDGQGTITDIVSASSGAKVQHYTYSSFGKLLQILNGSNQAVTDNPVVATRYTYTGREYDQKSGLYYYRARYYDPALGRFLTADPDPGVLASPKSFNSKYIYVLNNPINLTDPTGLWGTRSIRDDWNHLRETYIDPNEKELIWAGIIVVAAFTGGWYIGLTTEAIAGSLAYSLTTSIIQSDNGDDFIENFAINTVIGLSAAKFLKFAEGLSAGQMKTLSFMYAMGTMYSAYSMYEPCRSRARKMGASQSEAYAAGGTCSATVMGLGFWMAPAGTLAAPGQMQW